MPTNTLLCYALSWSPEQNTDFLICSSSPPRISARYVPSYPGRILLARDKIIPSMPEVLLLQWDNFINNSLAMRCSRSIFIICQLYRHTHTLCSPDVFKTKAILYAIMLFPFKQSAKTNTNALVTVQYNSTQQQTWRVKWLALQKWTQGGPGGQEAELSPKRTSVLMKA